MNVVEIQSLRCLCVEPVDDVHVLRLKRDVVLPRGKTGTVLKGEQAKSFCEDLNDLVDRPEPVVLCLEHIDIVPYAVLKRLLRFRDRCRKRNRRFCVTNVSLRLTRLMARYPVRDMQLNKQLSIYPRWEEAVTILSRN